VLRASFSGELAYELHCRPRIARSLWDSLHATGLQPYGIEALDILRVEKGYLTGGEMNGQVTPMDLGLEALVAKNPDAVGADLLDRPAFAEPRRPRLVGIQSADPNACPVPYLGTWIYAKFVIDSVAEQPARIFVRTTVDANCDFRSLLPGIPED
jgi:glycine cleavage system aminomethyltransferase T